MTSSDTRNLVREFRAAEIRLGLRKPKPKRAKPVPVPEPELPKPTPPPPGIRQTALGYYRVQAMVCGHWITAGTADTLDEAIARQAEVAELVASMPADLPMLAMRNRVRAAMNGTPVPDEAPPKPAKVVRPPFVGKSGIRGVNWNSNPEDWHARIVIGQSRLRFSAYATPEDAGAAYRHAANTACDLRAQGIAEEEICRLVREAVRLACPPTRPTTIRQRRLVPGVAAAPRSGEGGV